MSMMLSSKMLTVFLTTATASVSWAISMARSISMTFSSRMLTAFMIPARTASMMLAGFSTTTGSISSSSASFSTHNHFFNEELLLDLVGPTPSLAAGSDLLLSHASYSLLSSSIVNFLHSPSSVRPKNGVPKGVANVDVATSLSRKLSLVDLDIVSIHGMLYVSVLCVAM
ncbi:hypothetical protein C8Q76DRAFT_758501 [Earliella scabrosa]|nr:hypothetical protein C8Q76DRAFT_758501 [Earliella scabrosa]